MQSEHSITIIELFTIAAYIGFPVYVSGAILQGTLIYLLRLKQSRRLVIVALCIVTTFIASLLLALLL